MLETFLQNLLETGQAEVTTADPPDAELESIDGLLVEFEQSLRNCFPHQAPPLDLNAARWASSKFYRAAQCIAFREIDEHEVLDSLSAGEAPNPTIPSSHYSVDLLFRFLPDLMNYAKRASQEDPVVQKLTEWCVQWPLSSVGVSGLGETDICGFLNDVSLMTEYLNRIVNRKDIVRAQHPAVQQLLRTQLGNYPSLIDIAFLQLTTSQDQES